MNWLVDLPARGALVGAAGGVVAVLPAGAPEPAQVVLGCAVLVRSWVPARASVDRCRAVGPAAADACARTARQPSEPLVAGLALGIAGLLIAALVGSWLVRRRLQRIAAGRY